MKVYQVILSNVAEHLVIKEIVQANNKNHISLKNINRSLKILKYIRIKN